MKTSTRNAVSVRQVLHAFPNPCEATSDQIRKIFGLTWSVANDLRRMAIEHIVRMALTNPPETIPDGVRQVMNECGVCAEEARVWLRMQGRGYGV